MIAAAVKSCNMSIREGRIGNDEGNRLVARIPLELTVANLDEFKQRWGETCVNVQSSREWILDLSQTRFVDSAALGFFVGLNKRATDAGIPLRFTGIQSSVRQTFRIAKMESLLPDPETSPAVTTTGSPQQQPEP